MKNEIAFYSRESAMKVADTLVNEGYVVMVSVEEQLTILNYLNGNYAPYLERVVADRNSVVFMSREEFDFNYVSSEVIKEKGEET